MISQLLAPGANQIPLGISVEYAHHEDVLHENMHYHTRFMAKGFANDF
jgi:hypothetical protein